MFVLVRACMYVDYTELYLIFRFLNHHQVIKKKFTPRRRRIPLLHFGRSNSDRTVMGGERNLADAADGQTSVRFYLQTNEGDGAVATESAPDAVETNILPVTAAQEQRVQREAEMLLGRHAQPVRNSGLIRAFFAITVKSWKPIRRFRDLFTCDKLSVNPTKGGMVEAKTFPIQNIDFLDYLKCQSWVGKSVPRFNGTYKAYQSLEVNITYKGKLSVTTRADKRMTEPR